jgi:hypothetical protein
LVSQSFPSLEIIMLFFLDDLINKAMFRSLSCKLDYWQSSAKVISADLKRLPVVLMSRGWVRKFEFEFEFLYSVLPVGGLTAYPSTRGQRSLPYAQEYYRVMTLGGNFRFCSLRDLVFGAPLKKNY